MSEIHIPVAFAEFYNRVKNAQKKLQNVIFEHVPNVSMNMSVTCPSKSVQRVPKTAMNVSRGRAMNVSMNVSRTVSTICAPNAYTSRKCWKFIICLSEKSAQTFPRTCPWYSLERVPDILSNMSKIFSRTCPRTCPPICPPTCPQAIQKYLKTRKYCVFFCEKIHILVANALRKGEHF